ncbi:MAG: DUF4168 domain-containing protein [Cyanobacteria bacterium P01_C01_bin.118]
MMLHRHSRNAPPTPSWTRGSRRWVMGASIGLIISAWLPISTLWQPGYAQTFTSEEISNYAAAILAMEDVRRTAFVDISQLMDIAKEDITRYDLRCLSTDGLKTLPRTVRSQIRRVLINYCNNAQEIVLDTGLTVQVFNSITLNHQKDEELANQIKSEIVRLR